MYYVVGVGKVFQSDCLFLADSDIEPMHFSRLGSIPVSAVSFAHEVHSTHAQSRHEILQTCVWNQAILSLKPGKKKLLLWCVWNGLWDDFRLFQPCVFTDTHTQTLIYMYQLILFTARSNTNTFLNKLFRILDAWNKNDLSALILSFSGALICPWLCEHSPGLWRPSCENTAGTERVNVASTGGFLPERSSIAVPLWIRFLNTQTSDTHACYCCGDKWYIMYVCFITCKDLLLRGVLT